MSVLRKLALKRLSDREDVSVTVPPEIYQAESIATWNEFLNAQPEFQGLAGQLLSSVGRTPVVDAEDLRSGAKDYFLFGAPGRLGQLLRPPVR